MEKAVREALEAAAHLYFRVAPWQALEGEDTFGFRDPELGLLASASVLGNAGFTYGLALYLGEEGFQVAGRLARDEMDNDEFGFRSELLALYYTPASEVSLKARRHEGTLAPLGGRGRRVYPQAVRKEPARAARTPDDREALFLARALRAACDLAESGRLSPARLRSAGGVPVFVLGHSKIRQEVRPRAERAQTRKAGLAVDEDTRGRLGSRPRRGRLMVSVASTGMSVQGQQARVLIVYQPDQDLVVATEAFVGPDAMEQASRRLIEHLSGEGKARSGESIPLPEELITDSLELYGAIRDVLAEAGLRVLAMQDVPELAALKDHLRGYMQQRPRGEGGTHRGG